MRSVCWMTIVACVLPTMAGAQQRPVESTPTVRQLHATMIKPASETIFNVGREAPRTIAQWVAISSAAVTLVESGNLLMTFAPPTDRPTWIRLSRQLGAAGRAARSTAEARRLGTLMRTSDRLVVVCETCHARYRKQEPQE
jgi:hypothetical protein